MSTKLLVGIQKVMLKIYVKESQTPMWIVSCWALNLKWPELTLQQW